MIRLPVLASASTEVHDKCSRCGGKCCTYFALQFDTPTTWAAFDDIRWYCAHGGVQVFKEGRRWYLQVETRCNHLSERGLCGIYHTRPVICRQHSVKDCEFENEEPFDFAVHFTSSADVEAYMNKRWPRGRPQRGRRRKTRLPRGMTAP